MLTNGKDLNQDLILFVKLWDVLRLLKRILLARSVQQQDVLLWAFEAQELIVMTVTIDTVRSIGGAVDAIRPVREDGGQAIEARLVMSIHTIELRAERAKALAAGRRLLHLRPTTVIVRPQAQERRVTDH